MSEVKEMKSLTLNGMKYESFPDQTARAAAAGKLPGPASAKVGQYLKVTEVDESGKVVAVGAADAPAGSGSGQNPSQGTGITAEQVNALDGMFKVCAYKNDDVSAEYKRFRLAFNLDEAVAATGIVLSHVAITFEDETPVTLTATVEPENATDEIKWSSDNEDVAVVENGVVTPVDSGTCVITAKAGAVSASCAVTVEYAAPPTYTVKEYLKATGTQWIDTGVAITDNMSVECKVAYHAVNTGSAQEMGTIDSVDGKYRRSHFGVNSSDDLIVNGSAVKITDYTAGTEVVAKMSASTVSIAGKSGANTNDWPTGSVFYLFNRNKNMLTLNQSLCNASVYYCKFYEGETLAHNFVPAVRDTDGEPGMLDTVTNTFVTNAGSGTFEIG